MSLCFPTPEAAQYISIISCILFLIEVKRKRIMKVKVHSCDNW